MNTPNQKCPTAAPNCQTAVCCFIGCDKKATKHIYPRSGWTYDNYTHSCDDHVNDLMSEENDVVEKL